MIKRLRRMSAAALFLAALAAPAFGQGTAFTYQGKVELTGSPVTGTADFQFRLFDSSSGGTQIGSTQNLTGVSITNGLLNTTLDFGTGSLNGSARFLEVAVRSPSNTGNFVILTPRQRLSPTPYASFAETAQTANRPWLINGNDLVYSNGKVGIGTSLPVSLLDLSGSSDALRIRGAEPFVSITDTSTNKKAQLQNSAGRFFITSDAFLNGANGGAFTMYAPDGKVGIGTFNPTSRVEIAAQDALGISGFQPYITLRDTGANGSPRVLLSTGNGDFGVYSNSAIGRGSPSMIIKDNDWVGMGVGNPEFRLDLPNIASPDGRGRANRWDTYSSARWKNNVHTIEHGLDKVLHLRGVTFDWKPDHGGAHDVGFIAEEVGAIVPELVSWEADGKNAQGLAYDRVTALTVEAIKEQQLQIDELRKANDQLREQVAALLELARKEN